MDFIWPINIEISSNNGLFNAPTFKSSKSSAPIFNPHPTGKLRSGLKSWFSYQFDPILHWGIDNLFGHKSRQQAVENDIDPLVSNYQTFIELYFDNLLAVSQATGNLTYCSNEKQAIELFHDSAVKFKIITPVISKRWFLWRFKNILHCWFCDECGVPLGNVILNVSNNTGVLTAPPFNQSTFVIPQGKNEIDVF